MAWQHACTSMGSSTGRAPVRAPRHRIDLSSGPSHHRLGQQEAVKDLIAARIETGRPIHSRSTRLAERLETEQPFVPLHTRGRTDRPQPATSSGLRRLPRHLPRSIPDGSSPSLAATTLPLAGIPPRRRVERGADLPWHDAASPSTACARRSHGSTSSAHRTRTTTSGPMTGSRRSSTCDHGPRRLELNEGPDPRPNRRQAMRSLSVFVSSRHRHATGGSLHRGTTRPHMFPPPHPPRAPKGPATPRASRPDVRLLGAPEHTSDERVVRGPPATESARSRATHAPRATPPTAITTAGVWRGPDATFSSARLRSDDEVLCTPDQERRTTRLSRSQQLSP
jgi:hypothetical protein